MKISEGPISKVEGLNVCGTGDSLV